MTCQPRTRSICLVWMLSIGLLAEEDTRPPVQLIAPIFPQIDGLESSLYFAIVNPTEESQEITIRFYQSGIPPLDIRESVLTIPRQSKVSRYLSDLVDLEGLEDTSTPLRKHNAGVVRIQGETEIAVAAVQVSEATQWFQTVLVSPEPKGR